jgi:hypothetical protein
VPQTAAYDEIADWYEHEFLARTEPGTDPLGIEAALRALPGRGSGACLEIGCGTQGVRAKVGATHWPLPGLFHAFTDAGLAPERFAEGGEPVPTVLAIRARAGGASARGASDGAASQPG